MKTIKTINGDGFTIYVTKGAENLYYVEMADIDGDCIVSDDYDTEEKAFSAATLLAVTQTED
jgi:hypothetical protein